MTPLQSLVAAGTKLWLDSVDPDLIKLNRAQGATGATSNPIIIAGLLNTGRFDGDMKAFFAQGLDDEAVAWAMTDKLVKQAQDVFTGVWADTKGDDGWVSFELDPLLEDKAQTKNTAERTADYIALGKKWAAGHTNRMIKVPATPGGLGAIEELVAAGVAVNITLIFSDRQYQIARDAVYRGVQRVADKSKVKTVYSIFVSRVDVYTEKHVPTLSDAAQGQVGIVNAKRIWKMNKDFWADKGLARKQEMIFASTGAKKTPKNPNPDPTKYVAAFAGSDIETNPPQTNDDAQKSGKTFTKQVDQLPPADVLADIDAKVDVAKMEEVLMSEGLAAFADPHKALIKLIGDKRAALK
ncbi:MAG: transaldolase [Planctomycetes bacterium]|nr:transaldolase [Planctomycetota bacterium]